MGRVVAAKEHANLWLQSQLQKAFFMNQWKRKVTVLHRELSWLKGNSNTTLIVDLQIVGQVVVAPSVQT